MIVPKLRLVLPRVQPQTSVLRDCQCMPPCHGPSLYYRDFLTLLSDHHHDGGALLPLCAHWQSRWHHASDPMMIMMLASGAHSGWQAQAQAWARMSRPSRFSVVTVTVTVGAAPATVTGTVSSESMAALAGHRQ
eukprot:713067-Rhodomonas_salina.1